MLVVLERFTWLVEKKIKSESLSRKGLIFIFCPTGLYSIVVQSILIHTSGIRSLIKCIKVSGLDEKRRKKVFEEFRLLSCLRDIHIVR